jgi:hypothetical protein
MSPFDAGFEPIENLLPAGSPVYKIAETILFMREKPSQEHMIAVFNQNPKKLLGILLSNCRDDLINLEEILFLTVSVCVPCNARNMSAALGMLLQVKRNRKLSLALDRKKLELLPSNWRQGILAYSIRRSAFLTEECRESLEANPFQSPDMPHSLKWEQLCNRALTAVAAGHFGNK